LLLTISLERLSLRLPSQKPSRLKKENPDRDPWICSLIITYNNCGFATYYSSKVDFPPNIFATKIRPLPRTGMRLITYWCRFMHLNGTIKTFFLIRNSNPINVTQLDTNDLAFILATLQMWSPQIHSTYAISYLCTRNEIAVFKRKLPLKPTFSETNK